MYDGLTTAAGMFVDYTISRFEEVSDEMWRRASGRAG
jgi:hypothetical protein